MLRKASSLAGDWSKRVVGSRNRRQSHWWRLGVRLWQCDEEIVTDWCHCLGYGIVSHWDMVRKVAMRVEKREDSLNYRSRVTRDGCPGGWRSGQRSGSKIWIWKSLVVRWQVEVLGKEVQGIWQQMPLKRCSSRAIHEMIGTILHTGRNVYFEKMRISENRVNPWLSWKYLKIFPKESQEDTLSPNGH